MNEKKIIDIQINLAEGITEIAELQKRITELTAANKDLLYVEKEITKENGKKKTVREKNINLSEKERETVAANSVALKDYKQQLNLLIKESANQARTDLVKIGHIQKLEAEVSNLTLQYKRLSQEELSGTAGKQVLENLKTKREELSKLNEAYGNYSLGVGQYGRATNNLSIQLGMVMKELPNFAISARTGIMSLTNNLPMLAEAFKAVKLQQAEMIEQGKKAPSMFSLITKSIFGVTGIVSIAMVLLQLFNKQIVDWFTGLFKGKEATDQATVSLKNFNETIKDGNSLIKNAITDVQTVDTAFRQYKKGIITADEALVVFNENLGDNLGVHQDIETAMQAFNDLAPKYIEWSLKMAIAEKAKETAADLALKRISAEMQKDEEYLKWYEKFRLTWGATQEQINAWNRINESSADKRRKAAVSGAKEEEDAYSNLYKTLIDDANSFAKQWNLNSKELDKNQEKTQKVISATVAQFDYESRLMEERGRALEVGRERELEAIKTDNTKKINQSTQYIKRLEQQEINGVKGATKALAEARDKHIEYEKALEESGKRKILEINTKYDKLIADHALATLKHQYDMMQAQSYLSAQQQYDATVKFAEEEYDAKMKLLDLQNISEEKYIKDSTELWQQRQLTIANGEKKLTEDLYNENQARLNNELTALTVGQDEQFQKLSDVYDLKRQMLDNQLADELKKIGDNEKLRKSIEDKYRAERIALDKEEAVKKVEQWEFWAQKAMGVGSEVNNAISAFAEHELETWRIANEGKANFDAEYEQKKIEIQRNQAKREKALAVFDTTINTAAAIMKMLVDPGGTAGIVLSVLAGITGAAQIATILATPLPSLSSSGSKSSKSSKTTVTEKFHTGTYRPATPTEEQEITRTLLTTERVLSPSQTAIFDNIISRVQSYGGSQAITTGVGVSDTLAEQRMEMAFTRALRNMPNPVMSWTEYTNQAQRQKLLDRNTKFG
jgi:hypothetical protein